MSKQQQFDRLNIAGVEVDAVSLDEAAKYICNYAGDKSKPAGYVIKPYVEFLDRAAGDAELTKLLNEAELSVADGVAVLWAAHYLYAGPHSLWRFWLTLAQIIFAPKALAWPLPQRAAGTNFTWQLLETAAQQKLRVFLIGKATSEDIEAVAATIRQRLPDINIVGTAPGHDPEAKAGHVTESWYTMTAENVKRTVPEVTLVGMGFPLQEKVCARLAAVLPHGLLVGEGGTFDYQSFGGARQKAPATVQKLGLEWLWRLILEPSRLKRQLAIPRFIYRISRIR